MKFFVNATATYIFLLAESAVDLMRRFVLVVLALGSRRAGRYVDFSQRAWFSSLPMSFQWFRSIQSRKSNINDLEIPPINWKGTLNMKDPFELALYPILLWDLKPTTIIEIGSYAGGSAVWLADTAESLGLDCTVYSFDINMDRIAASHSKVVFRQADSNSIHSFPNAELARLPHPWLFIEDAHKNVEEILLHFDQFLMPGDYMVVEDTHVANPKKYRALQRFMRARGKSYKVDTRFTDMFGYNATWNVNGYLKRM